MNKYIDPYNKRDKFALIGYNAKFDYDFLRKWFEKQSFSYFGSFVWFPPIDVMNLAAFDSIERRSEIPNFKLGSLAKAYGINLIEDDLHDAFYDISITRDLYHRLRPSLLNGKKQ